MSNVNGLNFPVKQQRLAECIKKHNPWYPMYKRLTWDSKTQVDNERMERGVSCKQYQKRADVNFKTN